jgi:hypothetical protein
MISSLQRITCGGETAMEKQRKTFLSYSRVIKDFALKLAQELKSEGFHVWLDQLDIQAGARWDREVEKALQESEIFMIILTKSSVESENVLDEIGYAIDNGKRFLPVLLENCDIPLRLRRFQYVDFTNKSFDDGVESAKDLLRRLIAQPTIPQPQSSSVTSEQADAEHKVQEKMTSSKALPVEMKPEVASAVPQKKQGSKGLVIGIVAVVAIVICAIAFSGIRTLLNGGTPVATQAPAATEPPAEAPASQVNLYNVNIVRHFRGEFVQTGPEAWKEVVASDGTEFYFQELGRNEEEVSVYLWDEVRNIVIKLDLSQGQIWIDNNDGAGYIYLYDIESVEGQ